MRLRSPNNNVPLAYKSSARSPKIALNNKFYPKGPFPRLPVFKGNKLTLTDNDKHNDNTISLT